MKPLVLFVNSTEPHCGVHGMGQRIGMELHNLGNPDDPYCIEYVECCKSEQALQLIEGMRPSAIIWNYHPSTLPFAPEMVRCYPEIKHVGLLHEIAPETANYVEHIFPYRMVCDPSFPADNRTLFRSVRHIPRYVSRLAPNKRFVVGSFGFAVGGKMFPDIVQAAVLEFPGCLVRLHIPYAHFGDESGEWAQHYGNQCHEIAWSYPEIDLEVTHHFMDQEGLLHWLSSNDLNVFFYGPNPGRGIASAPDYAIAAGSSIAINGCQMFRHLSQALGTYPTTSLYKAWEQNGPKVNALYEEWTPNQLRADYWKMLETIL